jgi:hypothetical protein
MTLSGHLWAPGHITRPGVGSVLSFGLTPSGVVHRGHPDRVRAVRRRPRTSVYPVSIAGKCVDGKSSCVRSGVVYTKITIAGPRWIEKVWRTRAESPARRPECDGMADAARRSG